MSDSYDRTVHATSADRTVEIVRYDKAGRYRLERADGTKTNLGLKTAVTEALLLEADGGRIHLNRCGGMRFDAEIRKQKSATRR